MRDGYLRPALGSRGLKRADLAEAGRFSAPGRGPTQGPTYGDEAVVLSRPPTLSRRAFGPLRRKKREGRAGAFYRNVALSSAGGGARDSQVRALWLCRRRKKRKKIAPLESGATPSIKPSRGLHTSRWPAAGCQSSDDASTRADRRRSCAAGKAVSTQAVRAAKTTV